jgi:2'-5' RNA ligase
MVEGVDAARIFVAVPLPDEVRMALADLIGDVDLPGTVVPPANWHITLRFIGRTDDVAYDRLLASLDETDLGDVFDIEVGEMGSFPRPNRATVLWIGVDRGQTRLAEVAAEVKEAVEAAGFDPEDRPFRAHLTLSRIRPPVDVTGLIGSFPEVRLKWRCRSIVVYRSHLGRGGARYEPLETFPLVG